MKIRFANNYGGFTLDTSLTYFALDTAQVQMWYLSCDELHIFLQGRKKGLLLTKDSPELGSEANFNNLVKLLSVEFEDSKIVVNRFEGNSTVSDHAVFSSQLWESTSTTPSID